MKSKKIFWLFVLSIAGLLFSGYMSGVKFFTETCAFNESCPYFLGYPACYFGFALFVGVFIFSLLLFIKKIEIKSGLNFVSLFSGLGVVFAGNYAIQDLPVLFAGGFGSYVLGLPTCVLGLLFFSVIFVISIYPLKKAEK